MTDKNAEGMPGPESWEGRAAVAVLDALESVEKMDGASDGAKLTPLEKFMVLSAVTQIIAEMLTKAAENELSILRGALAQIESPIHPPAS